MHLLQKDCFCTLRSFLCSSLPAMARTLGQLGGPADECPWVQQVVIEESDLGKRRTPGQRAEDSDSEQPGEPASGLAGPVVVVDEEVEECQGRATRCFSRVHQTRTGQSDKKARPTACSRPHQTESKKLSGGHCLSLPSGNCRASHQEWLLQQGSCSRNLRLPRSKVEVGASWWCL